MPQKPLEWRSKKAKREGAARMMKLSDLERVDVSSHAAKKSRYVIAPALEADRNVSQKNHGRAQRPAPRTKPTDKHPNRELAPAVMSSEPHAQPRTSLRGRKKAPSQMHLKRPGGPRKRSPLHGG
jgi:hypothetical protein